MNIKPTLVTFCKYVKQFLNYACAPCLPQTTYYLRGFSHMGVGGRDMTRVHTATHDATGRGVTGTERVTFNPFHSLNKTYLSNDIQYLVSSLVFTLYSSSVFQVTPQPSDYMFHQEGHCPPNKTSLNHQGFNHCRVLRCA